MSKLSHQVYANIIGHAHSRALDVADEASAKHDFDIGFHFPIDGTNITEPDDDGGETSMPTGAFIIKMNGRHVTTVPVSFGMTKREMHAAIEASLARKVKETADGTAQLKALMGE